MRYRTLGRTGLEASVIGLGCNRVSEAPNRDETRATFELALARGVNLIDLADCYGHGNAERLVGRWLGKRRDELILCSKVGARPPYSVLFDRWIDPLRRWIPSKPERHGSKGRGRPAKNFKPRVLRAGIEGSLRRLGTDHLDLVYLHGPPPEVVADGAVFAALEQEQRAGRILHYGVSLSGTATTEQVLACFEHSGVSIVQVRINTRTTVDLERIEPVARQAGVAIVAREALLKGRLLEAGSGKPGAVGSAVRGPVMGEAAEIRTRAQILIQAVLQRPAVDALLVGTSRRTHLEDNLAVIDAPPLSERVLTELWARTKLL